MDPASVFGLASGAIQTIQILGATLQGLHTLKGKFSDADSTIHALTVQLVTIKHALNQLHDWAQYRTEASDHPDYVDGLDIALDGCRMSVELLLEEVSTLTADAPSNSGTLRLSRRAKVKVVWNEPLMKDHEQRLQSQMLALNFLLQVCQCRTETEQLKLLREEPNQKLMKKVADDVATLRTAARSTKHAPSITSNRQSTIGDTVFDFDDNVVNSTAYRRVFARHQSTSQRAATPDKPVQSSRQHSKKSSSSSTLDEGYASAIVRSPSSNTRTSTFLDFPSVGLPHDNVDLQFLQSSNKFYRSQSSASHPSTSLPEDSVRRSQSVGNTLLSRSAPSKKEKFRKTLQRLNTTSIGSLRSKPTFTHPTYSDSPVAERVRQQRNKCPQRSISIDVSLADNATTPPIIRAAQAGALVQVEIQIGQGVDIDCCHEASGRSALAVAAHCGKVEAVDYLIRQGANVDIKDADLSTPFHLAASRGHLSVIERLIEASDKVDEKDSNGRTALWVAAQEGHLETVEMLIASGFKMSVRAKFQLTALHAASMGGDVNMARLLVQYGADIEAKDALMKAPIHHACERGHVEIIALLLSYKADIEAVGEHRRTPLICAAMEGQTKVVQHLLKKKASSRCVDEHGMNCLHWAAINGQMEVVELLVQKKLSLRSVSNRGDTALHLAIGSGQFAVVEYLLRKGAPLEARCSDGFTPLHHACRSQSIEVTRLLLGSGADIEAQAKGKSCRPIHIAALQNNRGLLDLLCEKSANVDALDSSGYRPLSIACRHGYASLVERLLELGAAPRLRPENKQFDDSPLCLAAKGGHMEVVSILIDRGEPVDQHDESGYDPLLYAAYYGHLDVLKLLLLHSSVLQKYKLHQSFLQTGFDSRISITEAEKKIIKDLILQLGFPREPSPPAPELGYAAETWVADRGSVVESGAGVARVDQLPSPVHSSARTFHATFPSELPDNSYNPSRRAQSAAGQAEAAISHTQTASVGSQTDRPIAQMQVSHRTEPSVSSGISSISPPRSSPPVHLPLTREPAITPRQPSKNPRVETLSELPGQAPNLARPFNMPATLQGQHARVRPPNNHDPSRPLALSSLPEILQPNISVAEQSSAQQSSEVLTSQVEARIELREERDDESDNESICSFYTAPEEFDDMHECREWEDQDDTSDGESTISADPRPEVFGYMREFREIPSLQVQLVELEG